MEQQVETEDVTWAVPWSRSTEREDKLGAQTQVEELMASAWVIPLALHDPHRWKPYELAPPVVNKALDLHKITETEEDGLPQEESQQHA